MLRSLPLALVLLVAVAFLVWLFATGGGEAPVREGDLDADALPAGPHDAGGPTPMTADAVARVGIVGRDPVGGGPHVDYAPIFEKKLRMPLGLKVVTGRDLLDAVEKAVGDTLPIRFPDEQSLRRFRTSEFPVAAPTGEQEHRVHEVLEFVRRIGFEARPMERFLLLRPLEGDQEEPPPPDAPPPSKPR